MCRPRPLGHGGPCPRKSGSQWTRRWRKKDSNSRSRSKGTAVGRAPAVSREDLRLITPPSRSVRHLASATPGRPFRKSGTGSSNPPSSSGESDANLTSSSCRRTARARNEPSSASRYCLHRQYPTILANPARCSGGCRKSGSCSTISLYSSIAHVKAGGSRVVPKIRALYEATYFAGLRKAGMPEE